VELLEHGATTFVMTEVADVLVEGPVDTSRTGS